MKETNVIKPPRKQSLQTVCSEMQFAGLCEFVQPLLLQPLALGLNLAVSN